MNNISIAKIITDKILEKMEELVHSILLYGSSVSAKRNPNDVDLIVIFTEKEKPEDIHRLSEILNLFKVKIDAQILNIHDIRSVHFSHDSHGEFFIDVLKTAHVMHGTNPFLEIDIPYTRKVSSVIQKLQYYYFRAKKIQANESTGMDSTKYQYHRKKILLSLMDFELVYSGLGLSIDDENFLEVVNNNHLSLGLSSMEFEFLSGINKLTWQEIFILYQKIYFYSIDTLQPNVKVESKLIDNIYASESFVINTNKLIILASGCPTDYDESEIVSFLNIRGYSVVQFHYTATGNSLGNNFVAPEDDLKTVLEKYITTYSNITLLGNSYGGHAVLGLDCQNYTNVTKVIAISPVIDWTNLKSYETLPDYLVSKGGYMYRFDPVNMLAYMKSPCLLPINNNLNIIHGIKDDQIAMTEVIEYGISHNTNILQLNASHLSFNKLTKKYLSAISRLL